MAFPSSLSPFTPEWWLLEHPWQSHSTSCRFWDMLLTATSHSGSGFSDSTQAASVFPLEVPHFLRFNQPLNHLFLENFPDGEWWKNHIFSTLLDFSYSPILQIVQQWHEDIPKNLGFGGSQQYGDLPGQCFLSLNAHTNILKMQILVQWVWYGLESLHFW